MTKLTISRLACLNTVLAAGVALMVTSDIANARSDHRGNNAQNKGVSPHFVITGQPADVKRVLNDRTREKNKDKYAGKKKGCERIIVPTAGCAISSKDPVGSVHTGGITGGNRTPAPPSQSAGGPAAPKGLSSAATSVALSNGVSKSVIENGKGLTVTSNSPGTITVSNGTNSVTMAGGSLTLHGAQSVLAGSGLQLVHLANGDVSVAVSPILVSGASKSAPVPPGVGLKDDLKGAGSFYGSIVGAPVIGAAAIVMTPATVCFNNRRWISLNAGGRPCRPHFPFHEIVSTTLFSQKQLRCLSKLRRSFEIFGVLDERISIGHPCDVVANTAGASAGAGCCDSFAPFHG
jgi:hypothetical protein